MCHTRKSSIALQNHKKHLCESYIHTYLMYIFVYSNVIVQSLLAICCTQAGHEGVSCWEFYLSIISDDFRNVPNDIFCEYVHGVWC